MKRLGKVMAIGALCVMFVSSCVTIPKPTYEHSVAYIDYNSVTSQTGIFLTEATSLNQPYDGLGSVSAFVQDGYEITNIKQVNDTIYDSIYGYSVTKKKDKIKYGEYKLASPIEAVRLAANKAKEMDANGIINLQIRTVPGERTSYVVTGMAVKIKDK